MTLARPSVLSWLAERGRRPARRRPAQRTTAAGDDAGPGDTTGRAGGGRLRRRLLDLLRADDSARHPLLSWLIDRGAAPARDAGTASDAEGGTSEAPADAPGDRMRRRLLAVLRLTDVQRTLLDALPVPVIVTRPADHKLLHANPPARRWLDGYQPTDGIDLWSAVLDEPTRERFLLALQTEPGSVDALSARWSASGDFATATRLRLSARRFSFGARPALLTTLGSAAEAPGRGGAAAPAAGAAADADAEAERRALRATLAEAVAQGALRLRFQPRIDASSGLPTSVEALVEWQHPVHGTITAERWEAGSREAAQAGATGPLDPAFGWALAGACGQWRRWQDEGLPALPIGLRLPPGQALDERLATAVENAAATAGISAGAIELELPEPALGGDCAVARDVLARLQAAGCLLSVGGFGTGRLSLEALHGLPIDLLRIDASLVRALRPPSRVAGDAATGTAEQALPGMTLLGAIVELGRALGVRVGAHGVVHPEEEAALHRAGCDELQGALYGLPMSSATCAAWLRSQGEAHAATAEAAEAA